MVTAEQPDTPSVTDLFTSRSLLSLPDHLLKRILHESDAGAPLRFVCKAFAVAVAKTTTRVIISRQTIRDRVLLLRVFATFPDAKRVTLDFTDGGQDGNSCTWSANTDSDDAASLLAGALDALAALRHPLTSLAVLQLSCPLPLPSASTLGYLSSCGLSELELRDVSIQRSASDGALNLLRCHAPSSSQPSDRLSLADSIRARGAAMVRFACCLPALRRLSLCNAAFSIPDVASLAALTQLEELSLDGAMECGGDGLGCGAAPEAAASPAYRSLLASLPKLRRLRLPMAVALPAAFNSQCEGSTFGFDDDDGDKGTGFMVDDWDNGSFAGTEPVTTAWDLAGDSWGSAQSTGSGSSFDGWAALGLMSSGNGPASMSGVSPGANLDFGGLSATAGASAAGGCWSFPPVLEALTIPLCSLNGPVFRAACETYGKRGHGGEGCRSRSSSIGATPSSCDSYWGGGGGLRSLQVTCAPGYTVWEGSFLNAERDFAALSRLGPFLESLHLSLELGGSGRGVLRRDRLRGCLRHLRQLAGLRVLHVSETRQPLCFAARKSASSCRLDLLTHLLDEDGCEPPRPCADSLLPPPCLPPVARLRLTPAPALGSVQQPALLGSRPWSSEHLRLPISGMSPTVLASLALQPATAAPSAVAVGASPLAALSSSSVSPPSPCLDSLLSYWPELHTLVAGSQRAVRSSRGGRTRLVVPGSLDEVMVAMVEQEAGAQGAPLPYA